MIEVLHRAPAGATQAAAILAAWYAAGRPGVQKLAGTPCSE